MITVKRLREILAQLPDDGTCYAYEGEGTGIAIRYPDGGFSWIEAFDRDTEDAQTSWQKRMPTPPPPPVPRSAKPPGTILPPPCPLPPSTP